MADLVDYSQQDKHFIIMVMSSCHLPIHVIIVLLDNQQAKLCTLDKIGLLCVASQVHMYMHLASKQSSKLILIVSHLNVRSAVRT